MAAITVNKRSVPNGTGETLVEFYGTSGATQADTFTTPTVDAGGRWNLVCVIVPYDAAPTYTGTALTVTIDSGNGAAYDVALTNASDNTRYFIYLPTKDIPLLPGDAIVVATPSGGGSVKSSVSVKVRQE